MAWQINVPSYDEEMSLLSTASAAKTGLTVATNLKDRVTSSIRACAIVSGLAILLYSIMDFIFQVANFHVMYGLLRVYAALFAILILYVESDSKALPYDKIVKPWLEQHFPFLRFVIGRGVLHIIAGTLLLTEDVGKNNLRASVYVGLYAIAVGVAYIVTGKRAADKVEEIRSHSKISVRRLRQKFHNADTDGSGAISFDEFRGLLQELGIETTKQEAEVLFVPLDKSFDNCLSFDEFQKFWDASEFDQISVATEKIMADYSPRK